MGTALVQGDLWGARARDYAELVEGFFRPAFEAVLAAAAVGAGTGLLDVGCGTGLAAWIAAGCGARVSGIDAAEPSIAIARERTPGGDFRVGEMEELPWTTAMFDVATAFNAFQFAADPVGAVREAGRVTRLGGRVAVAAWGPDAACETVAAVGAALRALAPAPPPAGAQQPVASGHPEVLLRQAGLTPLGVGEVDCPFTFRDEATAVRALTSVAPFVAAARRLGDGPVRREVAEALAPFRTPVGGYHLRNHLRYAIATA
jgi:SAM-dependent methyltransferase